MEKQARHRKPPKMGNNGGVPPSSTSTENVSISANSALSKQIKITPAALPNGQPLPFLPPVLVAMAQIQRVTAMRSGEVCKMRFCDIEMHDDVWLYHPETHKTSWRGHQRVVVLGLAYNPNCYCLVFVRCV
ncbi:hypothetical protein FACS18942_01820 [Planctomycetales bacterium]|nr:hypothetical protein FACS18942_01820 [Planctomycetales bacterium]